MVYMMYIHICGQSETIIMNMRVAKLELRGPPRIKLGSLVLEAMLLVAVSILLVLFIG